MIAKIIVGKMMIPGPAEKRNTYKRSGRLIIPMECSLYSNCSSTHSNLQGDRMQLLCIELSIKILGDLVCPNHARSVVLVADYSKVKQRNTAITCVCWIFNIIGFWVASVLNWVVGWLICLILIILC